MHECKLRTNLDELKNRKGVNIMEMTQISKRGFMDKNLITHNQNKAGYTASGAPKRLYKRVDE